MSGDVRGLFAELGVELPHRDGELSIRCFANADAHRNGDRRPSLSLNTASGAWNCHSCGAKGGPYDAALACGRTSADAMRLLERFGLRRDTAAAQVTRAQATPLVTENELDRHRTRLRDAPDVQARLEELRGWTPEAIERLELGFDGGRVVFPLRDMSGVLAGVARYAHDPVRRNGGAKMVADKGSRRELFPAPETLEPGATVWLVEGEPDAVLLHSFGLAATAVPGVAKWSAEWAARFAGRRVIVCFDSDAAGREAARRAADGLAGIAAEVRLLDLGPELDDGTDLSDVFGSARGDTERTEAREILERSATRAARVDRPAETLDGSGLLDELVSFVRTYVSLSEVQAVAVALWILHTHAFEAADTTPYLSIGSAEKGSGKTRLLETLELLVAKPWYTGRVTAAVLARKVHAEGPTLLLDESDAAFNGDETYSEGLRGMLNSGHRRGGKTSVCVGQGANISYTDFGTFAPKAIAGIGVLPDTVAHRSIRVEMKRKRPDEPIARFRHRDTVAAAEPLRTQAGEWASAHVEELTEARPEVPRELDDRAADGWEPLLAIADLLGGECPARARAAALELSGGEAREDDSIGVRLLADVRRVFDENGDRITSAALIERLVADEDAPWGDWRGKPITSRALARILKRFGIQSRSIRIDDGTTPKGFRREQFEDAWKRYLPVDPGSIRHNATTRMATGIAPFSYPPQDPLVADTKKGSNPHEQRVVADVADRNPETGAEPC